MSTFLILAGIAPLVVLVLHYFKTRKDLKEEVEMLFDTFQAKVDDIISKPEEENSIKENIELMKCILNAVLKTPLTEEDKEAELSTKNYKYNNIYLPKNYMLEYFVVLLNALQQLNIAISFAEGMEEYSKFLKGFDFNDDDEQ